MRCVLQLFMIGLERAMRQFPYFRRMNFPDYPHHYKISAEGLTGVKKLLGKRVLIIGVLALLLSGLVAFFQDSDTKLTLPLRVITVIPPTLLIVFVLFWNYRKQLKNVQSFELMITADSILSISGYDSTEIRHCDIQKVLRTPAGGYLIHGQRNAILVPPYLERRDELEADLQSIHAPSEAVPKKMSDATKMLFITAIAAVISLLVFANKIVVGLSGIVLIGIMLYGLYSVQVNPILPKDTRRKMLLLLLPVFSIAVAIYKHWTSL
jgi:hypothetical protein